MHLGLRERFFRKLDRLIVILSSRKYALFGPQLNYQPLPWLKLAEGRRALGCMRRWEAIRSYLDENGLEPAATLDVGANLGFFSISLADRGAIAYAVEGEPLNVRIANIASQHLDGTKGQLVLIRLWCDDETVKSLPEVDVSICLSVWHHWVKNFGLDRTTLLMNRLLERTRTVMFFDTGENEMPADYKLPFAGADSKAWILNYLSGLNGVGRVRCLGDFEAFMPTQDENAADVKRHLFAVEKK